jgi:quinol monooxygenase YgiN
MVMSVCALSRASRNTFTTLFKLGSGQVEQPCRLQAKNEPGTRMYTAWQQKDDPTRFVHLFEFADEAAHRAHGASAAVRQFEAVYGPELTDGPVVFTDYVLIATNRGQ